VPVYEGRLETIGERLVSKKEGRACASGAPDGHSVTYLVPFLLRPSLSLSLSLLLSLSLSVLLALSRRPSAYRSNGPRNVRFLTIVIEILLLLNWELTSGYAVAPVVKKLGGGTAMLDDNRPILRWRNIVSYSFASLPNPSPKSDIISRMTHAAAMR